MRNLWDKLLHSDIFFYSIVFVVCAVVGAGGTVYINHNNNIRAECYAISETQYDYNKCIFEKGKIS